MDRGETSCSSCDKTDCSATQRKPEESVKDFEDRQALSRRMCRVKHKVLVLSGKGGVGKSTVAVNMAVSLAAAGKRVGLLDVDIHGPSIPRLLGLENRRLTFDGETPIIPLSFEEKLKVMSIAFFLPSADEAVIWRGPLKISLVRQFLRDVEWGELDYLIIDSPPGTGDEPLSVIQLIEDISGAVIVTTPQEVALADVRKSINFCRRVGLRVLGVVENMSGFVCPGCGMPHEIFKSGGGETMAGDMGVPFLGRIPIDAGVVTACDSGKPFCQSREETQAAKAFAEIVGPILSLGAKKEAVA